MRDTFRNHVPTAELLSALAGTLAATYPLLAGRSLVSPWNGPTVILYDAPPYSYGAPEGEVENTRGIDVGALMWAILPFTVVQRTTLAHGEFPPESTTPPAP